MVDYYRRLCRWMTATAALMLVLSHCTVARKIKPVIWTANNPMFRVDNTDHVIDVAIGDRVDILCPKYAPGTYEEQLERHIIYQVTRDEYESCSIYHKDRRLTRQVLACTRPHDEQSLSIIFREFTPMPKGLEFHRGQDYYYISTSNGTRAGLHNKAGGGCSRDHMKMIFKVCCNSDPEPTLPPLPTPPQQQQPPHHHRHHHANHANKIPAVEREDNEVITHHAPPSFLNDESIAKDEFEAIINKYGIDAFADATDTIKVKKHRRKHVEEEELDIVPQVAYLYSNAPASSLSSSSSPWQLLASLSIACFLLTCHR